MRGDLREAVNYNSYMPSTYLKLLRNSSLWIAILLFTASILGRFLYRGVYFPGWDILGAAQGQYLIETQGLWQAITQTIYETRHYQYWTPISSCLYTIIPGFLSIIYPWELWASLLTFSLFLLILRLMFYIAKLDRGDIPLFLFVITSASAFLSFSVSGYPFLSGVLPHALALGLIYSPKLRSRPLITFILGCLIAELSMNLYELGRTAALIFISFAFLDKKASKKLKLAWIGSASLFIFNIFYYRTSFSNNTLLNYKTVFGILPTLKITLTEARLDSPLVFVAGLASCFFLKKDRIPLILNFLAQLFLVFLLFATSGEGELKSRRLLVLEFYSMLLLLLAWKDSSNKLYSNSKLTVSGKAVLSLVFLGSCWQAFNLYEFTRPSITNRDFSLPFTNSQGDYRINPKLPEILSKLEMSVASGKKIMLLYNYFSYSENTTDPNGLPERLYIRLGHQKFSEQILIFSDIKQRYSHVPIREPKDLADIIPILKRENSFKNIEIWKITNEIDSRSKAEVLSQMTVLQSYFNLKKCSVVVPDWDCFKVESLK